MRLYHGSNHTIEKPVFGGGLAMNDYGSGFYCTKNIELAKEWAATPKKDAIVNTYELNEKGLKLLHLEDEQYSILNWLAILLRNRLVKFSSPIQKQGSEYILKNFSVDISGCDAITGYRADDSYFRFARAFLSNTISLEQLREAMKLGKLGLQYVLKSEKAFKQIHFVSSEPIDAVLYYEKRCKRNSEAEDRYEQIVKEYDTNGLYLNQIIKERIKANDSRI